MPRLDLCLNCLESGAVQFPIGHEKGHQMDRYREMVPLCPSCKGALEKGDFGLLASRYRDERVIRRETDL